MFFQKRVSRRRRRSKENTRKRKRQKQTEKKKKTRTKKSKPYLEYWELKQMLRKKSSVCVLGVGGCEHSNKVKDKRPSALSNLWQL